MMVISINTYIFSPQETKNVIPNHIIIMRVICLLKILWTFLKNSKYFCIHFNSNGKSIASGEN